MGYRVAAYTYTSRCMQLNAHAMGFSGPAAPKDIQNAADPFDVITNFSYQRVLNVRAAARVLHSALCHYKCLSRRIRIIQRLLLVWHYNIPCQRN